MSISKGIDMNVHFFQCECHSHYGEEHNEFCGWGPDYDSMVLNLGLVKRPKREINSKQIPIFTPVPSNVVIT